MNLKIHADLAKKHKKEWLAFARHNGVILNKAKVDMERGDWITYVENETNITMRTAQKWMRIATGWALLPADNDFSIDEAYGYILDYYK